VWSGTANPDGPGLLERGREFQPTAREQLDPLVLEAAVVVARVAQRACEYLRECPEATVRRSAALLAARAHPVLATFDE
jgi:hypothetical protein